MAEETPNEIQKTMFRHDRTMKESPIDDPLFGHVVIRPDGRAVHSMYLLQVKAPDESKDKWDVFKVTATIPAEQAFRPLDQGGCPLVPHDRRERSS